MEINKDARVYDNGMITVVEIMGRHAGWLAASAALATEFGSGPDLVYLPEVDFDMDRFLSDVQRVYEKTGKVLVAVLIPAHEPGSFWELAASGISDGLRASADPVESEGVNRAEALAASADIVLWLGGETLKEFNNFAKSYMMGNGAIAVAAFFRTRIARITRISNYI